MTLAHASTNNLRDLTASFPLGRLVAVTGVSGSGKSSLIADTLVPALEARLREASSGLPRLLSDESGADASEREARAAFAPKASLTGTLPESLEFVDQSSLGKTTRGNPASYAGAFTGIRAFFGGSPEATAAALGPGDFSFNSGKGRCPRCAGTGSEHVEMQFLSDVWLPCPECRGARYRNEILAIRPLLPDGSRKSIAEVLALTVDEALAAFAGIPAIVRPLDILRMTGLGYLTLGQPSPTLSGGEAQRIKLVTELAKVRPDGTFGGRAKRTLYVLDEPTVGLHMADVARLSRVLSRLVDAGSTVLVIEHNLDVIADADRVIDLGPEGGEAGGRIVAEGSPCGSSSPNTSRRLRLDPDEKRPEGKSSGPLHLRA